MSEDDDRVKHTYSITLLIIHPDMDPDVITRTLGAIGIQPYTSFMAGKMSFTPKGTEMGIARDTRWNYVEDFFDDVRFFEMMGKMVVKLHAHFRDFFRQIVSEGGTVMLIVNLPGKRNQGDTLAPELLGKMADMSVSLGVETFPDSNRFDN
ncbi:MAG: hypothetical protein IPH06_07700 [Alphaproteobacteria bacterium]|jgi:hypothetical protein|nr:hypothetical protein [Alphaproteobacteria bacterium]QQS57892.1 MAG: hypothetical protein IPN28_03460 [Alphaproteobacteria bacterium]